MKEGSDNFRESAVLDIIEKLKIKNVKIYVYEPFIDTDFFDDIEVISDIKSFIDKSDLIIANRLSSELKSVENKVYSRDIYREN